MKEAAKRAIFGDVYPISKDEWTKEVTETSKEKQCWVIAYLWDTAVDDCKLADQLVRELSKRHRDVKFVSIQSQVCIENWPTRYVTKAHAYILLGVLTTHYIAICPLCLCIMVGRYVIKYCRCIN